MANNWASTGSLWQVLPGARDRCLKSFRRSWQGRDPFYQCVAACPCTIRLLAFCARRLCRLPEKKIKVNNFKIRKNTAQLTCNSSSYSLLGGYGVMHRNRSRTVCVVAVLEGLSPVASKEWDLRCLCTSGLDPELPPWGVSVDLRKFNLSSRI